MERFLTNLRTSTDKPYSSFLQKSFQKTKSEPYFDDENVPCYMPIVCKELQQSFNFDPDFNTHVYAAGLTDNGKTLSIFEQDGLVPRASLSMHQYQLEDSGKIKFNRVCHRQTWLIRDYDFTVSYDGSFVVMFNSEENAHERDHRRRRKRGYGLGEKVCISLLMFEFDSNIPKASFYPNAYILTFSNSDKDVEERASIWKYRHGYTVCRDCRTFIVSTWGVTRDILDDHDNLNEEVLLLDFFSIDFSSKYIKHVRQLDLSSLLDSIPLPIVFKDPNVVCNKKIDKILIKSHDLVYLVKHHKVVRVSEAMYEECYWVHDQQHGEMIISIDQSFLMQGSNVLVKVYKQDNTIKDFELCSDFAISELFQNTQNSYFCHGVSDVDVLLCIEPRWFKRRVFLVDPIASRSVACLSIPEYIVEPYVRKVLVVGTEIIVVIQSVQKEILCIYEISKCNPNIPSLKKLCSVKLLQMFSLKHIQSLNIPKVLQVYLEDFLM